MEVEASRYKDVADKNELLFWACTRGLLPDAVALLHEGAEASAKDKTGRRPVHYAASQGHLDVLEYLGTKGVDLDIEDARGRSPLHYAAASGHIRVVELLVRKGGWLEATDDGDDTAVHLAARLGHTATVKTLVGAGAKLGLINKRSLTPLAEALLAGHLAAALLLMDAGASIKDFKARGFSLLHIAAGLGQSPAVEFLLRQEAPSPGAMTDMAVANDKANAEGYTPLHAAALGGSVECAELLIRHGAKGTTLSADALLPVDLVQVIAGAEGPSKLQEVLRQAAGQKAAGSIFSFGGAKKAPVAAVPETAAMHSAAKAVVAAKAAMAAKLAAARAAATEEDGEDDSFEGRFSRLKKSDQIAKVNAYARMDEAEVKELRHLSEIGRIAIHQVRKVSDVLSNWQAIAALRRDEEFQADVVDPHVQRAMEVLKQHPGHPDRYANDSAVMSVLSKLKKLHAALRMSSMKVGLEDLMVHSHPDNALDKTEQQICSLQDSLVRAQEDAVAVLCGCEPPSVTRSRAAKAKAAEEAQTAPGAKGTPQTASATDSTAAATFAGLQNALASELEAGAEGHQKESWSTNRFHKWDWDKQGHPAGQSLYVSLTRGIIPTFLPYPLELLDLNAQQVLTRGVVDLAWHALRALTIACLVLAIMWWCGVLPYQLEAAQEAALGHPAHGAKLPLDNSPLEGMEEL